MECPQRDGLTTNKARHERDIVRASVCETPFRTKSKTSVGSWRGRGDQVGERERPFTEAHGAHNARRQTCLKASVLNVISLEMMGVEGQTTRSSWPAFASRCLCAHRHHLPRLDPGFYLSLWTTKAITIGLSFRVLRSRDPEPSDDSAFPSHPARDFPAALQ